MRRLSPARAARALFALVLLAAEGFVGLEAQPLSDLVLGPGDIRITARDDGGYDLYLRKKPDIASVLLTETTKDPAMKADNFAYRAAEYNEVNGGEKRLLNGKPLLPSGKLYSLISSTPRSDSEFGQAYRILIPSILVYGYPWSRSGAVSVGKGTFINIRAFAKPYADYAGPFQDNPYQIAIAAIAPPPPQPEPLPAPPKQAPQEAAPQKAPPPPPPDDRTSSKIGAAIETAQGKSLDLVVCLDTTASMVPYIDDIRKNLGPILRERVKGFASFRIGVVLFKDYWPDEYITRKYPFTSDIGVFERIVKSANVYGGGDIPEAEFEALYSAATEFDWSADLRQVILVTDAPPHPEALGKIVFSDVVRELGGRHIDADAIIEPATIVPPDPAHVELEKVSKGIDFLKSSDPKFKLVDEGRPAAFPSDAAAVKAAKDAGAGYVVVTSRHALGALSETVSRLIDAANGKTLQRDVSWRALSSGIETLFVNGFRVK
jgi:hypothetical protein